MKITREMLEAFVDSLKDPFMFVDTDHVIRFMNKAAIAAYKRGAGHLGESIFICHNEDSCRIIREVFAKMQEGLEEQLITDNDRFRIFMRAVREGSGRLLGYYERYEPPVKRKE
ncbi:MAG: PAS domain-containing protein [Deltaproteobacteria bacterium]|nr:PAS domain-containing protein [Deltaproteobacteria bacterium]